MAICKVIDGHDGTTKDRKWAALAVPSEDRTSGQTWKWKSVERLAVTLVRQDLGRTIQNQKNAREPLIFSYY
jgi:hypothetical protein